MLGDSLTATSLSTVGTASLTSVTYTGALLDPNYIDSEEQGLYCTTSTTTLSTTSTASTVVDGIDSNRAAETTQAVSYIESLDENEVNDLLAQIDANLDNRENANAVQRTRKRNDLI